MTKVRVSAARGVATQVLGEVRRREARARDVLRGSKFVEALDERDRAHVTRMVMGVVGTVGLLDKAIDRHVRARSGVEPKVRDALRVSTYELLFLSTPASAAVSQGVELVRGVRPRAAGMANAVLRRIAEEDANQRIQALGRVGAGGARVDDLAWASGYPTWLLARVGDDRGNEAAREFALSATEPAPVYVAPNLAQVTDDEAYEALVAHDLFPVATDLPGSYELRHPARLARLGLVQDAKIVPADLSAQHVVDLVVPSGGGRLLEVGQGRATKSMLLQNAAHRKGCELHITGVDSVGFKTKVARKRMRSAGLEDRVRCVTFDARQLADPAAKKVLGTSEAFDTVFVDAPCSGTGTLRRHPEISWSLSGEDVDALCELQLSMLCAAATWVRPGGTLCYATCSVLKQENEDVVDAFLHSATGVPFAMADEPFQSLPRIAEPDGHFCIRLERKADFR